MGVKAPGLRHYNRQPKVVVPLPDCPWTTRINLPYLERIGCGKARGRSQDCPQTLAEDRCPSHFTVYPECPNRAGNDPTMCGHVTMTATTATTASGRHARALAHSCLHHRAQRDCPEGHPLEVIDTFEVRG